MRKCTISLGERKRMDLLYFPCSPDLGEGALNIVVEECYSCRRQAASMRHRWEGLLGYSLVDLNPLGRYRLVLS